MWGSALRCGGPSARRRACPTGSRKPACLSGALTGSFVVACERPCGESLARCEPRESMKEYPEGFGDKDEAGTIEFTGAAGRLSSEIFAGRANFDA
jgi:hypothetical protein